MGPSDRDRFFVVLHYLESTLSSVRLRSATVIVPDQSIGAGSVLEDRREDILLLQTDLLKF